MRVLFRSGLAVVAASVLLLYAQARFRTAPGDRERSDSDVSPGPSVVTGTSKHFVTSEMLAASGAMTSREAPGFVKTATDGRTYSLAEVTRNGPLVLTFIKKGCPCSEAVQRFFNQLRDAYPAATFLGVIDTDVDQARRWEVRFRARYPLLPDSGLELTRAYNVQSSAYVILVDGSGHIAKYWPGISTGMLCELGTDLARLTATPEKPIDTFGASDELCAGCPFDL
jgi:peroxiredoxin